MKINDCYLTVGQLKEKLKNYPDDSNVYYEVIEDKMFENHNWEMFLKETEYKGSYIKFVKVFGTIKYKEDNNLYLSAHY